MAVFSIAAASAPETSSGKFTGFIAGAILIAIVIYAFITYLRPLTEDPESGLFPALLVLAGLAVVKLLVMPYCPGFGPDVGDYQAWGSQIATFGPAHTYAQGFFLDYPPGYLYALWVVGILAHAIGATGDFYRVIIESPAIVADLVLAILVYAYMRRGGRPEMAFIAMLMVALNPALLFDTVVWGQSDSVMTFVTLLSIVAILGEQYEIAWGLAAIAVLVKPQGLMMLPVLGIWTMLETDFATWIRSGIALIAVFVIGIAPFQIGHEWNWIIKLYTSTAAYYHETSVNAFNLMALLGGLRQADSTTFAGVSFFALGMSLLVPLYAFVAWILWSGRTPTRLMFASFIAIFGFFMVAPRMHERYLYPALALAVPLALEAPEMLAVFAILTITCFINLVYVLHTLNTVVFLDARDGLAMATSALNVVALGLAVYWGSMRMQDASTGSSAIGDFFERFATPRQVEDYVEEPAASAPPWIATDTIIIAILLIAAAITRYWNLSHPSEIVFDEVHFVAQGRHYLHGESFLDPHPPLAKLVISLGILLFGDNPFGWRVGNATIGTALVGITYLLGRRMTGSRLVGAIAGAIILCDGMYLVDSHYAVIDIVYLTCAAIAYLLFFKFEQTTRSESAPAHPAVDRVGAGIVPGEQTLHPGDHFFAGGRLHDLCDRARSSESRNARAGAGRAEAGDRLEAEESQNARAGVSVAVNLFDQTSALFISATCIVLALLFYLSGGTVSYIVLVVIAFLAIRIAEQFWRSRSSPSAAAQSWQMPSMADLLEPMNIGAVVLVGAVASITYLAVFFRTTISDGGAASRTCSSTTRTSFGMSRAFRRRRIRTPRDGGVGR